MKNGNCQENHFERKVIALERYFYKRPNPNVIMIGRFEGAASNEQVISAISKVRKRHPLLMTRVQQEDDGNAYLRMDSVGESSIEIVEGESFDTDELIEKALREIKVRQPLDRGPLIRFVLFRTPGRFDLLINCHHMICDGLSLYYLIRDIFVQLGNPDEDIERLPEPVIVENNLPPDAVLNNYFKRLIMRMNKSWEKKGIFFDDEAHKKLHEKFWKIEHGLKLHHWNLSEQQTASLIQMCKKEKISVHSALCTAFLIAQIEVQGKKPYLKNISMPVSVRNRLTVPVGEDFGLFFSSFKLKFKKPKKDNFWDNARAVHDYIQKEITNRNVFTIYVQLKNLHPTLVDSISYTKYGELDDKLAKRFLKLEGDYTLNTGLDISNLGALKLPEISGQLKLKSIIGPSCYNEFQEKYLGVATLGGEMHFTVTYREPVVGAGTVEKLRKVAMRELGEATNW